MSDRKKLISFTYNGSHQIDLSRGPYYESTEASGVWVFGDEAWKIFPNTKQYHRILKAHTEATEHRLPTPWFRLQEGTVVDNRKRVTAGFALVTGHITGSVRFLKLKSDTKTLKTLVNHITNDTTLSRCVADCIKLQED